MLEFYLNSKPLLLDRAKSVKMTHRNPACNVSEFPGDVAMGIDIPVNEVNRALLGHPDMYENYAKGSKKEYPGFEIRYSGVLLMSGTLIVTNATHENYTANLRSEVGNLGKEHREKFIFDSQSFNKSKTFENKAHYDCETDDYGCPRVYNMEFFTDKGEKVNIDLKVLNPNYTGEFWSAVTFWTKKDNNKYIHSSKEVEDLTWAFMRTNGYMVNAKNADGTVKLNVSTTNAAADSVARELEVSVVSPMLFLNFILKHIFLDAGFVLDNNFLAEHDDLKKLMLYNNFDITQVSYAKSTVDVIINSWNNGDIELYPVIYGKEVNQVTRDYEKTFYYRDLIPLVRLKDFLLGIQNYLNVFFFPRPGRKIFDVIDRESILTEPAIDLEKWFTGYWEIDDKKDVTLHFTFDHEDSDLNFKDRWQNIDELRDKEKKPVKFWEDLAAIENPQMEEIRFIESQNRYVQYKLWMLTEPDPVTGNDRQKKYLGWNHLTYGFQNGFFNYGKEEVEKVETCFGPIEGEEYPKVRQKGNIRSELFSFETFKPRLLFYLGNNEASYRTNNISLEWEREDTSLLRSRWMNWARFWCNREPVTCTMDFSLNQLDFVLRNIYKKFRTREGEFIIEEMETEFGLDQIGITTIKGYKINYAPVVYQLTDMWKINDPIWVDNKIREDFNWKLLQ